MTDAQSVSGSLVYLATRSGSHLAGVLLYYSQEEDGKVWGYVWQSECTLPVTVETYSQEQNSNTILMPLVCEVFIWLVKLDGSRYKADTYGLVGN